MHLFVDRMGIAAAAVENPDVGARLPLQFHGAPKTVVFAGPNRVSVSLRKSVTKIDLALVATFIGSLFYAFIVTQSQFAEVWRTGAFFDTDDAMRAVELRDFLAGQSWFDLTAHRLDPPNGLQMHWSRIVDVALAVLQKPFSLFLGAATGRTGHAPSVSVLAACGAARCSPVGSAAFSPARARASSPFVS